MAKKVLVISTSLRGGSNSDRMAQEFAKGAREAGNTVEEVSLKGKDIRYCIGCMSCMESKKCVLKDDANTIRELVQKADVIAFATPIYYFEMCGQMKTLLDRMNPLFTAEYAFRDIYMLSCAAEDGEQVPVRAVSGLEGWIACFEKARLAGTVFAGGVEGPKSIEGHKALTEAFEMGKRV